MILHIFNKQEKFSVQYIKFLKDNGIDLSQQQVFHYGKSSGKLEEMGINVLFSSFLSLIKHIKLYKMMKKADKIIIHSLASPFLLMLLFFKASVSERFYWVIWGKDLYFTQCVNMKNPLMKMYEFLRKRALKNVKYVITNVEDDFALAKEWYHMDAKLIFVEGMSYPYNSGQSDESELVLKEKLQFILLGNSASVSNNHLEALEALKKQDDGEIEIVCPLSYGGKQKYVETIIKKGKELFGERFSPLKDFMPLDEYNKILKAVDVAFFYHDRQEAFSNTLTLLSSGKKIYMRKESTLWNYFLKKGIVVHDSDNAQDAVQDPDDMSVMQRNCLLVSQIRDVGLSLKCWEMIFNENNTKK